VLRAVKKQARGTEIGSLFNVKALYKRVIALHILIASQSIGKRTCYRLRPLDKHLEHPFVLIVSPEAMQPQDLFKDLHIQEGSPGLCHLRCKAYLVDGFKLAKHNQMHHWLTVSFLLLELSNLDLILQALLNLSHLCLGLVFEIEDQLSLVSMECHCQVKQWVFEISVTKAHVDEAVVVG
jgi:hypothetical protein